MSSTSVITARVPAEQAEAVLEGFKQILATLGLPFAPLDMETVPKAPDVVEMAREALKELDIDPATVTRLVFTTDEWDNGYFFDGNPKVVFKNPEDAFDVYAENSEFDEIAEALYEMHGGPLGRSSEAVIDLITGDVDTGY